MISDSQNYNSGSYCDTESYTVSSSQFDSTSLALGTSGTITGGTDSQSEAGFNSSSQSYILTGNAYLTDPDGGPAYGAYVSQLSIITDSLYSSDQGTLTFGSLGTVSGGNDCFTFIQANSASHLINESTPSDNITDSGTDYYSQAMTGTETLGTGGSVASGSDSFSWTETASDMYTLVQYGGGTSGLYNEYQLTLLDQMYEGFTDTGTDILGSSDSILGGTDTYTSVEQHNLWSTLVANGTSANPYYISASDWDLLTQRDVGSSTLTTNGHVYATDTITYVENTGAAAIDDQTSSTSGPGWQQNWQCNGYAYDNYNNNNTTTQTISDTLTTTVDNFAVSDTHSISDSYNETSVSGAFGLNAQDTEVESDSFWAQGTLTSRGNNYTFLSIQSDYDDEVFGASVAGQWNIAATEVTGNVVSSYGTEWTVGSQQGYSWTENTVTQNVENDGGEITMYQSGSGGTTQTITQSFSQSQWTTTTLGYVITGPPLNRVEGTPSTNSGGSGSTPSNINLSALVVLNLNTGYSSVEGVAGKAGTSSPNTALHLGTSPGGLNTNAGLYSAMGAAAAHPLQFTGGEMGAELNSGSSAVVIEEGVPTGGGPGTTWVSEPAGIGYRRPGTASSGSGSSGSGSGSTFLTGNGAVMDDGTSDGSDAAELTRLQTYDTGANETPGVTQPAPTPRAAEKETVGMNDINNVASSPDQMSNPPPEGNGPLTQLSAPRGPASKMMVGDLNWLLGWLGVSDETAPPPTALPAPAPDLAPQPSYPQYTPAPTPEPTPQPPAPAPTPDDPPLEDCPGTPEYYQKHGGGPDGDQPPAAPGDNFVGDGEEGGTWDDDQPKGDPSVTGQVGQALGQIVPAAVDALATAEEIGVAGAEGFLQGAANLLNSGTDAVFGLANLVPRIYNNTAGNLRYRPLSYLDAPDWSKGLVTYEDPLDRKISRGAGDVAVAAGSFVLGPKIPVNLPGLSLGIAGVQGGAAVLAPALKLQTAGQVAVGAVGSLGSLNQMAMTGLGSYQRSGNAPKRTLTPDQVTRGMEISPADTNIYRGGDSLNARVGVDIQIDKATGLVKPTHGLSLDVDAVAMQKFGGAYQVESIPAELKIIQRGARMGHFEIVPREAMTPERFQELANQIVLKPAGG